MKNVYRVFAYLVAAGVMVQAASIAYSFFSLGNWVDGGGTFDKSSTTFPGIVGLEIHGIGSLVVLAIALIFLILSFFAKVPGGIKWGLIVFITAVVQVALGIAAHSVSILGVLHGILALVLFGVAATAAMRVGPATAVSASDQTSAGAPVG
jgi:heme A synthase